MNHTESLFIISVLLMALKYPQHLDAMLIVAIVFFVTNILLDAYKAYLEWKIRKSKKTTHNTSYTTNCRINKD